MNITETARVMDLLEVAYPRYYVGISDARRESALKMWASAFEKDDVRLVLAAVKSFVDGDEKGFPPVPGQIRAKMRLIVGHGDATPLEAWALVTKAMRDCGCTMADAREQFDKLPPMVRRIVGTPAQLREWSLMGLETVNSVIASQFQRSYREAAEREREYEALPSDVRGLVDRLAAAREAPALGGGVGCAE